MVQVSVFFSADDSNSRRALQAMMDQQASVLPPPSTKTDAGTVSTQEDWSSSSSSLDHQEQLDKHRGLDDSCHAQCLAPRRPLQVELPDGTCTTIVDIMEKLKNTLPLGDLERQTTIYRKSVSWVALIRTLCASLHIREAAAIQFCHEELIRRNRVLCQVVPGMSFRETPEALYRLHCDHTPFVLNSYTAFSNDDVNAATAMALLVCASVATWEDVIDRLDALLAELEHHCVDASTGRLDFKAVHEHALFPRLEDAVCELQTLGGLLESSHAPQQRLAIGLNVYHILLKYAVLKLGVLPPANENNKSTDKQRDAFFHSLQFNVGGVLYTFSEWQDCLVATGGELQQEQLAAANAAAGFSLPHQVILALHTGWALGCSLGMPFRLFSGASVLQELQVACTVYLNDDCHLWLASPPSRNKLYLSKLLLRFATKDRKIEFVQKLARHVTSPVKSQQLQSLLKLHASGAIGSPRIFPNPETDDNDWTRNVSNYTTFFASVLEPNIKNGLLQQLRRRFKPAPTPNNESLRWTTLRCLNILDTLPEERFDRITRMVQADFNVPLVFMTLVDEQRQWFKSTQWKCASLPADAAPSETPRDISFCGHTINGFANGILCIPDATQDDRFAHNPAVTGPLAVRFYAGCNLSVPAVVGGGEPGETVNIGTLCMVDQKPRPYLTEEEQDLLRTYALQIRDEIVKRDRANATPEQELLFRAQMGLSSKSLRSVATTAALSSRSFK